MMSKAIDAGRESGGTGDAVRRGACVEFEDMVVAGIRRRGASDADTLAQSLKQFGLRLARWLCGAAFQNSRDKRKTNGQLCSARGLGILPGFRCLRVTGTGCSSSQLNPIRLYPWRDQKAATLDGCAPQNTSVSDEIGSETAIPLTFFGVGFAVAEEWLTKTLPEKRATLVRPPVFDPGMALAAISTNTGMRRPA